MIKNFLMQTDYWDFLQFLSNEERGMIISGVFWYVDVYNSYEASALNAVDNNEEDYETVFNAQEQALELATKQVQGLDEQKTAMVEKLLSKIIEDIKRNHKRYTQNILNAKKGGKK